MKKIRKAFTLVELTVAMAISVVVLAAGTVLFFMFNKGVQETRKQSEILNELRIISAAFNNALVYEENAGIDISEKSIGKDEEKVVFTISRNEEVLEYHFNTKNFWYINTSNSEREDLISLANENYLDIKKYGDSNMYQFVFTSGLDMKSKIELVRAI